MIDSIIKLDDQGKVTFTGYGYVDDDGVQKLVESLDQLPKTVRDGASISSARLRRLKQEKETDCERSI